ncbi:hypothetical protein QSH14_03365 [Proteus faecis]|uniref:Uncharacterized protein n=2 Tax=Proteus faecis TaxID=2050967 RepID=A0AAW7CIB9_9GAMM|nr:hypothetical protein [Proteus faecis]MDL5166127.1 hypothetical protein [Proteus faecis]MDL5273609.1 hypothetical protein [Proteus faecis]MDL5277179.1 hypothetical protein [Proteus faecis]MDL5306169.1 hypothetical protein [Proteus faecis]MDL5309736.1 hypothetical protein [Proteus faecis]
MKGIQISVIKKLSKKRRELYLKSTLNIENIDSQLSILIPILSETTSEIKKRQYQKQSKPFQIKEISQFFEYLTESDKKEKAINALEFLLFCFENGCKTIKKVISQELTPLVKDIEYLIDFELKKIIKTSSFSLFGFFKA